MVGQRSDSPRSMSGRSPGRQRARPPRAVSSSVCVSRRSFSPPANEEPVELAEQKATDWRRRRRDDDGQAAAPDEVGGLEPDDGRLAALAAAQDGEARIVGEEHVALPGIERQAETRSAQATESSSCWSRSGRCGELRRRAPAARRSACGARRCRRSSLTRRRAASAAARGARAGSWRFSAAISSCSSTVWKRFDAALDRGRRS